MTSANPRRRALARIAVATGVLLGAGLTILPLSGQVQPRPGPIQQQSVFKFWNEDTPQGSCCGGPTQYVPMWNYGGPDCLVCHQAMTAEPQGAGRAGRVSQDWSLEWTSDAPSPCARFSF